VYTAQYSKGEEVDVRDVENTGRVLHASGQALLEGRRQVDQGWDGESGGSVAPGPGGMTFDTCRPVEELSTEELSARIRQLLGGVGTATQALDGLVARVRTSGTGAASVRRCCFLGLAHALAPLRTGTDQAQIRARNGYADERT